MVSTVPVAARWVAERLGVALATPSARPGRARRPARARAAAQPAPRAPAGLARARQARADRPAAGPRRRPAARRAGRRRAGRASAGRCRSTAARGVCAEPTAPAGGTRAAREPAASAPVADSSCSASPRRPRRSGTASPTRSAAPTTCTPPAAPVPGVAPFGAVRGGALPRHRAPAAARRPGRCSSRAGRWCSSTTSSPPAAPRSTRSRRCTARAPRERYVVAALVDLRSGDDRARFAGWPTSSGARSTSWRWPAARSTCPPDVAERGAAGWSRRRRAASRTERARGRRTCAGSTLAWPRGRAGERPARLRPPRPPRLLAAHRRSSPTSSPRRCRAGTSPGGRRACSCSAPRS